MMTRPPFTALALIVASLAMASCKADKSKPRLTAPEGEAAATGGAADVGKAVEPGAASGGDTGPGGSPAGETKTEPAGETKTEPAGETKTEPAGETKSEAETEPAGEETAPAKPAAKHKAKPPGKHKTRPPAKHKVEPAAKHKTESADEPRTDPAAKHKTGSAGGPRTELAVQLETELSAQARQGDDRKPSNLKALPTSWSLTQVKDYMKKQVTHGVGVKCDYCHVKNDYASDRSEHKKAARSMIRMTERLNAQYFGGKAALTCFTCHRGHVKLAAAR